MAKNKRPLVDRIRDRLLYKMRRGSSILKAAEYTCHMARTQKRIKEKIFKVAQEVNPLIATKARMLDQEITDRKAKRLQAAQEQALRNAQEFYEREAVRIQELEEQFAQAKSNNSEIRWGVQLDTRDRKLFFSKAEIAEITSLRREGIVTSKVRSLLDCTLTELDRWDKQGLLPHAYKRKIQLSVKAVEARFWLESEVLAAKEEIADWRKAHNINKSFKRKKKPLKVVK